jgi:hypothetical protein
MKPNHAKIQLLKRSCYNSLILNHVRLETITDEKKIDSKAQVQILHKSACLVSQYYCRVYYN